MANLVGTTVGSRSLVAKTCIECMELKDAKHYRRINRRHYLLWESRCKTCHYKRVNQYDKIANHQSWHTNVKQREAWSQQDIRVLKAMTEEGKSRAEIGQKLGRSIAAVGVARSRYLNSKE